MKIHAKVSVEGSKSYAIGDTITMKIHLHNPMDEPATFKCFPKLGGSIPREGAEEITLSAGEDQEVSH